MFALEHAHESEPHRTPNETLYGYCWCRPQAAGVPSLQLACCDILVRNLSTLRRLLPSLPVLLTRPLLARAIDIGHPRAAQLLVSVWPGDSLDLQAVLGVSCAIGQHPRRLAAVAAIVMAFVEMALSGKVPARLHRLDVTGFQCGRELIEFVDLRMTIFSKKQPGEHDIRTLRCDFLVSELRTFHVFCNMLNHGSCALRIEAANLEVEGVGERGLFELLGMMRGEQLVGLCIANNSLQNHRLQNLCERLRLLRGLVALDISSNGMWPVDAHHYDPMADMLQGLPRLQRLSLRSCGIGGNISVLLSRYYRQLSHLDVRACGLRRQDLHVIGSLESLESLLLSDNNLSGLIPELATALLALAHLRFVQLSNCYLRSASFDVVWSALKASGEQLHWLDLTWNRLSEEKLIGLVVDLEAGGCLPRLTQLLVPMPINPSHRYFEAVRRIETTCPRLRLRTSLV